jgi:hypothetical protein
MLVSNQKYGAGDIVSFKLVNGDEVVAKIIEEQDLAYVVANPCTVVPSPQGLGLIQSLFSANENVNITLSKSHVMMSAESVSQMKSHYTKTTTGIQTIEKPGIII